MVKLEAKHLILWINLPKGVPCLFLYLAMSALIAAFGLFRNSPMRSVVVVTTLQVALQIFDTTVLQPQFVPNRHVRKFRVTIDLVKMRRDLYIDDKKQGRAISDACRSPIPPLLIGKEDSIQAFSVRCKLKSDSKEFLSTSS